MAEQWEASPDGLTWTFHLRETLVVGRHAGDGGGFPVCVAAASSIPRLAASYAYFPYIIKNAQKINAGHLPGTALGVTAPAPRTLEVQLEQPAPYLPEMLMHNSMMPVPRHVVESQGQGLGQARHLCLQRRLHS